MEQSLEGHHKPVTAHTTLRCIAWVLLSALTCVWIAASYHRFKNLDPRFDQSGNAAISRQMSRADHFFPRRAYPGQPLAIAQEADRTSWLRAPARTYIVETIVTFDATSIFANYVFMKLWQPVYRTTIFTSIAFRSVEALLIAGWSVILFGSRRSIGLWYAAFFAGGLLTLVCGYTTWFSPWGAHNFAVTFLLIALFCVERALRLWRHDKLTWKMLAVCAIAQVLALYSYSACTLLLLLAVPMSILLVKERRWRERGLAALGYVVFVLLAGSPVLLRYHASPTQPGSDSQSLHRVAMSAIGWWQAGAAYYSWEGLLLGLAGLALLCRKRVFVPMCLVVAHFLLWTFMPTFTWNLTATGLRTFNYLLPWLALGGAASLMAALRAPQRWRIPLTAAVVLLLAAHWTIQVRMISSKSAFLRRVPLFNDLYLNRQGEIGYFVSQIDHQLPAGATLLAGDALIRDSFEVMTTRGDLLDKLPPPGDSLYRWSRQGELFDYLTVHNGMHFDCRNAYALIADKDLQTFAQLIRDPALGCGDAAGFVALRRFSLPDDHLSVTPLTLYSIEQKQPPVSATKS